MNLRLALMLACYIWVPSACSRRPPEPPVGSRAAVAHAGGVVEARERGPTTSGSIAVRNLDAAIAQNEKRVAASPTHAAMDPLIALLSTRALYLGRLEDDERAFALAERFVELAPKEGRAYLARARIRARFHLFPLALKDLQNARSLGADAAAADLLEASVLVAIGRVEEALPILRSRAEARPGLEELAALAGAEAELGRYDEAETLYRRAHAAYRDVSPFPLAWLEFQEGLLRERRGDLRGAGERWATAYARLPAYAAAATHLAEVEAVQGSRTRAAALVRDALAQTDDPVHAAQLAELLRPTDPAEADRLLAWAKDGVRQRTRKHPAAFADHAAQFWLGPGGDAGEAFRLAEANVRIRPTASAWSLYLEAASAATPDKACNAVEEARKLAVDSGLIARAEAACGTSSREP